MSYFKFILSFNDTNLDVVPRWGDGTLLEIEKESEQVFYRRKLAGQLTFQRQYFDIIHAAAFETEFILTIQEGDNDGNYSDYWKGVFFKTDCNIDEDNRTLTVQPEPVDRYQKIIEGLDREIDLVKVRPLQSRINYVKRPLIQIYLTGANTISNFLGGTYWETEVPTPVTDETELTETFHFKKAFDKAYVPGDSDFGGLYDGHTRVKDDGKYVIINDTLIPHFWYFRNRATGQNEAFGGSIEQVSLYGFPQHAQNDIVFGFGQFGSKVFRVTAYIRMLTDVEDINGVESFDLPETDIVDPLGYKKVIPLDAPNIVLSDAHQTEPTAYGTFASDSQWYANEYFPEYSHPTQGRAFPVLRSSWSQYAIWFYYDDAVRNLQNNASINVDGVVTYTIDNAIKTLVRELDTTIIHSGSAIYSQFLYSLVNPVSNVAEPRLTMTPITNVTVGEYDQPAQKAIVTLREVLNMLRDTYNLFWFIDDANNLVIEHISYFENGGHYTEKVTGADLTNLIEPKGQKRWSFNTRNYKFEKFQMPERLTFKWQNNVSDPFEGFPIVIKSRYVQGGNIKEYQLSKFTSDLDFMLAQPALIGQEGFALLGGSGLVTMEVPIVEVDLNGAIFQVQNGQLSFIYLHSNFWKHGLPAKSVTINDQPVTALSASRHKVQEVTFPATTEPNPMQLIRTLLGDGKVDKMSRNLDDLTIKATIKHDTQN